MTETTVAGWRFEHDPEWTPEVVDLGDRTAVVFRHGSSSEPVRVFGGDQRDGATVLNWMTVPSGT